MAEQRTDLKSAAETRYLNYALSVITARALPDVRDGLKPVQRRILYAMFRDLRLSGGAKPRKSAAVVGEVLGKYHPHGDTSSYEAMVRMAQTFSLRYPLVEGEGNFGSLDGDGAAAMRYTEARLAQISDALTDDLRNETVPFRQNYDATTEEPVVLPAAVPQLLMNGTTGIAVGMATNIPPHNLTELLSALVAMIDDPKADSKTVLKFVKGPDFPTGGEMLNSKAELREIYETGHGAIRLRGEYTVEKGKRGKQQIIITSVPYTVNKGAMVADIGERVGDRKIPQIVDVRDESTGDVRIVLELKNDASPEVAMAYLYKHTQLETRFNVNLTALIPTVNPLVGQPARLSLLEMCRHFLDFRLEIVTKRLEYEKRKLEERLHILDALAKIHADLDLAIRLIRSAESRSDARQKLMDGFDLDEIQADAILEIRLYQLAKLEIAKIEKERKEKRSRLREVNKLLADPGLRWTLVRDELLESKAKWGDKRRTRLAKGGDDVEYDPDAYVVHEEATVLLTRDGWVKRLRELKEGAKPRIREGDELLRVMPGTTRDRVAIFTTFGSLFVVAVGDLPATTGYGEPVQSMFRFADSERVLDARLVPADPETVDTESQGSLFAAPAAEGAQYLLGTAKGFGFRFTPDFSPTTKAGRRIARVAKGDEIVSIGPVHGDQVVCGAARGKMLRFHLDDVSELSGAGKGVYLMRPGDADDRIIAAIAVDIGDRLEIEPVEGKDRSIRVDEVPIGNRGGKGLKVVKRGGIAAFGRRG